MRPSPHPNHSSPGKRSTTRAAQPRQPPHHRPHEQVERYTPPPRPPPAPTPLTNRETSHRPHHTTPANHLTPRRRARPATATPRLPRAPDPRSRTGRYIDTPPRRHHLPQPHTDLENDPPPAPHAPATTSPPTPFTAGRARRSIHPPRGHHPPRPTSPTGEPLHRPHHTTPATARHRLPRPGAPVGTTFRPAPHAPAPAHLVTTADQHGRASASPAPPHEQVDRYTPPRSTIRPGATTARYNVPRRREGHRKRCVIGHLPTGIGSEPPTWASVGRTHFRITVGAC